MVASASYALIAPENKVNSADIDVFTDSAMLIAPPHSFSGQFNYASEEKIEATELKSIEHVIQSGESLSSIFSKLNLNKSDLHQILQTKEAAQQFAEITTGKKLKLKTTRDGDLKQITYQKNALETITATRENDTFNVIVSNKQIEKHISSTSGTIRSSLFMDGKEAGLPDKIIMQLSDIFAWDIDFALDIKENDRFAVLYEKLYVGEQEVGTGNILAAEFVNQGKTYKAVRYQDKHGRANYYTPEGLGMRKAFIRTPVDFARISSPFNLKRKHPVLNRIRAHKGVDYAAKTGTPIKCTGDGKIIFQGRQNGYGRVIIVQHGKHYSTLYAHLSAFSKRYKKGSVVMQGTTIGYVGQSGLASGPHLHYEFRVNGQHRDPLTVALPNSAPVNQSLMADFKATTQPLLAQLDQARATTLLAQN